MDVQKIVFGKTPDVPDIYLYTLTKASGLRVRIMTYGAIVVSIEVPDRNGQRADIVLGFDNLGQYLEEHPYFGAIVGRYGNRIAKGHFTWRGVEYTLVKNDGENHLHGGTKGFDKVYWDAKELTGEEGAGLELSYFSKDGEDFRPHCRSG